MRPHLHPLIVVIGPTGSGKSALALWLASQVDGEVVNCDSVQLYRHFDIGSAKVPAAERMGIRHHLIDILDPQEVFSAGEYARVGREALREIAGRGKAPVVVGGTGFYARALMDGLFAGPARNESLRARLAGREKRRPGSLHRILRRLDARAAGRIHANDRNKLIRALEVCLLTRRPLTELHAEGSEPLEGFEAVWIGLDPPRAELYQVLNQRVVKMFEGGLVEEARRILEMGYPESAKPFESLGYKQALALVRGNCSYPEAVEETRKETRRYAKRQWTWFKKDTRVSTIPGFGHSLQVQQTALDIVTARLFREA
ncbi:MAG: tRNA (adenosine(37)-N6)-dimethylallyltransferase MiaA [Bryobacterales bacterium]|nr:tRNA (adenosine(37)-N6)-dimethylallyltransferase MiaA [Bryobacterales bacterium]